MALSRPASLALLVLAVVAGTFLRLWPSLPPRHTDFLADGAAIARLAKESASTLRLPAVDSLAEAPAGRTLPPVLAPGLIVGAGAFHRLMAALGSRNVDFDLILFGALAGGLVAVPVYWWARVQWGAGVAAPFAALLIVFLPAHLHRTFGYLLRYDAPGALWVAAHLAALAASLRAERAPRRALLAAGSAAALALACWTWRVPLVMPGIEAGILAIALIARGADRGVREVFAIQTLALSLALLPVAYVRAQGVETGPLWLATIAVAAVAWVPRLAPGRATALERAAWVIAALAAAVVAGRSLGGASSYDVTGSMLAARLGALTGASPPEEPWTRLMLGIEELRPLPPEVVLVGAMNLALAGPWLLGSPLVFWLAAGHPRRLGLARIPPAAWMLAGVTVATFALTVFIDRAKVLLALPTAVVVGGVLQALLARSGWSAPRAPRARPATHAPAPRTARERHAALRRRIEAEDAAEARPFGRTMFAAALVLSLLANLWFSGVIAATRLAHLPEGERAALEFLRDHTPREAIVASLWEYGYEVESVAGRRTLMDGFLESPSGRERAMGFARAGFARSTEPLAAWCRKLGARWLLVPPSTQLSGLAMLAEPALVPRLQHRMRLQPDEANRTIVRMMVFGSAEPPFYKVFDQDLWRVYALDDSSQALPGTKPAPFK